MPTVEIDRLALLALRLLPDEPERAMQVWADAFERASAAGLERELFRLHVVQMNHEARFGDRDALGGAHRAGRARRAGPAPRVDRRVAARQAAGPVPRGPGHRLHRRPARTRRDPRGCRRAARPDRAGLARPDGRPLPRLPARLGRGAAARLPRAAAPDRTAPERPAGLIANTKKNIGYSPPAGAEPRPRARLPRGRVVPLRAAADDAAQAVGAQGLGAVPAAARRRRARRAADAAGRAAGTRRAAGSGHDDVRGGRAARGRRDRALLPASARRADGAAARGRGSDRRRGRARDPRARRVRARAAAVRHRRARRRGRGAARLRADLGQLARDRGAGLPRARGAARGARRRLRARLCAAVPARRHARRAREEGRRDPPHRPARRPPDAPRAPRRSRSSLRAASARWPRRPRPRSSSATRCWSGACARSSGCRRACATARPTATR